MNTYPELTHCRNISNYMVVYPWHILPNKIYRSQVPNQKRQFWGGFSLLVFWKFWCFLVCQLGCASQLGCLGSKAIYSWGYPMYNWGIICYIWYILVLYRIGLRENPQDTQFSTIKYRGFLQTFPLNQSNEYYIPLLLRYIMIYPIIVHSWLDISHYIHYC